MDSMHDLGGKQGFGPVPVTTGDAPFAFDWERRMWGLARAGILRGITIDWFRHGLECMVPGDYLTYRYFQKWATNYLMEMIDNGTITLDEVVSGQTATPAAPAEVKTVEDVIAINRGGHISFETEAPVPAGFAVGDRVRTKRFTSSGHTRLPAYARNCEGTIITYHGSHALPDEGARGHHVGDHLYTVSFTAPDLWGPEANPRDTVTLELWESYLVPA